MASTTTTTPPATTAAAIAPPPATTVPSNISSNSSVTAFYSHVVQHVMQNVRPDFEAEGLDETVLEELQTLWENKLKDANVLPADYKRPAPSPPPAAPDLNLDPSYEGAEGFMGRPIYEGEMMTPTADMLFSPMPYTPKPGMVSTPGPGQTPSVSTPYYSTPDDPGNYSQYDPRRIVEDGAGRSSLFVPGPFLSPQESPVIDMNVAYVENRDDGYVYPSQGLPETKDYMGISSVNKRKRDFQTTFPQTDGAGDACSLGSLVSRAHDKNEERKCADNVVASMLQGRNSRMIPQLDGINDSYDNHVTEEDYNLPAEEEDSGDAQGDDDDGGTKAGKGEGDGDSDDSEPPLNEDDDDDEVGDFGDGEGASKTDDLVFAQFEKVTKVKGKWKCILKDGIMSLNNKDFLFSKANGEFDFF